MKATLVLLLALSALSVHAQSPTSATYNCTTSATSIGISIRTNTNMFTEVAADRLMLSTDGLFPEFSGVTSDLHECRYSKTTTVRTNAGAVELQEKIETGIHCTTSSLAGDYDYRSVFTIKVLSDVRKNPSSFEAVIAPSKYAKSAFGKEFRMTCKR